MTEGQKLKETLKSKEDIAEKDRTQRDKESKRKFVSDIIGSVTSPLGRIGSSVISKGAKATKYIMNDAAWYKKWVESTYRFTNYPTFNNMKSFIPALGMKDIDSNDAVVRTLGTPGVMEIEYFPSLGHVPSISGGLAPLTETVPLNVALSRSLSQIRKSSGRAANYNPDVLGLYWLSAIEIAQFLADLKCALEIVLHYQPNNTYLPDTLLRAKGWDPVFVKNNRADLLKMYSLYAARFNSNIAIPADLSLLQRRIWLPSVILKDATLQRAQHYVFHQSVNGIFRTDETGIDFAGDNVTKASISSITAYLEASFTNIEESVTMIALVADIRSGIPANKFARLPVEISDSAPVYDASHEVLLQIHNIKPMPMAIHTEVKCAAVETNGTYIYNITGSTTTRHTFGNANNAATFSKLVKEVSKENVCIDSYSPDLTGDDILVATRFVTTYDCDPVSAGSADVQFTIMSSGTEVCSSLKVWVNNNVANTDIYYDFGLFISSVTIETLYCLSVFDWAPVLYNYGVSSSNAYARSYAPFGELGNAFVMQNEAVREIHRMCVSSEGYLDDSVFTAAFGKAY